MVGTLSDRPKLGPRPRVLFIDDWLPDPRMGSGAPRALAFMRAITAAGSPLTFAPVTEDPPDGMTSRLLPGAELARGYRRQDLGRLLAEHGGEFDVIFVSRPHNMHALRAAAAKQPDFSMRRVVYDAEALFSSRDALRREVIGEPNPPERLEHETTEELGLVDGTRMVIAVDGATADLFRGCGHPDVRVLGHATVERPTPAEFHRRDGFLFVGPTYLDDTPNSDSIIWFCDHVLPHIRRAMARPVPFVFVGQQRSAEVAARETGGTRSLGAVEDLTEAYSAARVFVAPTRFAAGIPLKVYDAAAAGLPVVLTPLLAGQLGWRHEEEVLVAESPQDFAKACVRLHDDKALWTRLRRRALHRVQQECDPRRFNDAVAEILEAAGA